MDVTTFLDDEPSTFKVFGAHIVGWRWGAKLKGGWGSLRLEMPKGRVAPPFKLGSTRGRVAQVVKLVVVDLLGKPNLGATWSAITPPFCCACSEHS